MRWTTFTRRDMKQLFNESDYQELVCRIESLTSTHPARWGRMNVNQMLCHCSDPLRELLGLRPTKDVSTLFSRTLAKWGSLYLIREWPPEKYPTAPEYDQQMNGTPVTDFLTDKNTLLQLLAEIRTQPEWFVFHRHPYFGKLNRSETGLLIYNHLNHHLRQFGV